MKKFRFIWDVTPKKKVNAITKQDPEDQFRKNHQSRPKRAAEIAAVHKTSNDTHAAAIVQHYDKENITSQAAKDVFVDPQRPYATPALLSSEDLRWQLSATLVGGLGVLLLYSAVFNRPLFV